MNTIDLEQMFEDAQTMHLQEFISYYSSQSSTPAGEDVTKLAQSILEKYPSTIIVDWRELGYKESDVLKAMVEMYKAALQNKVPVSGLRWVKAEDNMPQKEGRVVVKRLGEEMICDVRKFKDGKMKFVTPNGMVWNGYKKFEWLDETLPITTIK